MNSSNGSQLAIDLLPVVDCPAASVLQPNVSWCPTETFWISLISNMPAALHPSRIFRRRFDRLFNYSVLTLQAGQKSFILRILTFTALHCLVQSMTFAFHLTRRKNPPPLLNQPLWDGVMVARLLHERRILHLVHFQFCFEPFHLHRLTEMSSTSTLWVSPKKNVRTAR